MPQLVIVMICHSKMLTNRTYNPGAGVLTVHVSDDYDFSTNCFEQAVRTNVPVHTSFGRLAPQLCERGRGVVYLTLRKSVGLLYEEWNKRMGTKEKTPVINRSYMEAWCNKLSIDIETLFARLGVAMELDTVDFGTTSHGGRKIVITTFENDYGVSLSQKWSGNPAEYERNLEYLTDVVIFTTLAKINRQTIYSEVCAALGWRRYHSDEFMLHTIMNGFSIDEWRIHTYEVLAKKDSPYILPYLKDSWLICQSRGVGEPWKTIQDESEIKTKVRNIIETKISVTCMPIEWCWSAEYNQ